MVNKKKMKQLLLTLFTLLFITSGFAQSLNENMVKESSSETFKEIINATDAKIYPNPCKQEKVTIELSQNEIKEISLTNITGKVVFLENYLVPENKKQIQLNDIPNGLYIIKVKTSKNTLVVKKLMVSNI
jgi:hypothetical protein